MVSDNTPEILYNMKKLRLNPCCAGRWSLTFKSLVLEITLEDVLILVVLADGL